MKDKKVFNPTGEREYPGNWLKDFQEGGQVAFKLLYDKSIEHLTFYLIKEFPCAQSEREDTITDAFVYVFEKRHQMESFDNAKAILFLKAKNISIDKLRRYYVKRRIHRRPDFPYNNWIVEEETTDREMYLHTLVEKAKQEIEHLAPRTKVVIEYFFFHGYSKFEIADILHCSPQTVLNLKAEGIHKLINSCGGRRSSKRICVSF